MLKRLQDLMAKRDEGFTLIELLVVVIIIGILAAIAIPVFLNQRNGARDASVKADANAMAKLLETYYTDNNTYPVIADLPAATSGVRVSPGNELAVAYYDRAGTASTAANAVSYRICGYNAESNKAFVYDSADGGLVDVGFVPAAGVVACSANFTATASGGNTVNWVAADRDLGAGEDNLVD